MIPLFMVQNLYWWYFEDKKLKKCHFKQFILFTVSLFNLETANYSEIIETNMKNITANNIKIVRL